MGQEIKTFCLTLPFNIGSVNCYLVAGGDGFILVDTGSAQNYAVLDQELEAAGCKPGALRLIILTHGDFDHTGCAARLADKYATKIAMHPADWGMLERGDMFVNRKNASGPLRMVAPLLFGFGKAQKRRPDLALNDGDDLAAYGWAARVVSIPGHSAGSIGVLTAEGDLICGDLFENIQKPALNSIMDDLASAEASIEKLKGMSVKTVYPGHGKPFPLDEFIINPL